MGSSKTHVPVKRKVYPAFASEAPTSVQPAFEPQALEKLAFEPLVYTSPVNKTLRMHKDLLKDRQRGILSAFEDDMRSPNESLSIISLLKFQISHLLLHQ